MTMRKYNEVETGELDDMDEYYLYKLKRKMSELNPQFARGNFKIWRQSFHSLL